MKFSVLILTLGMTTSTMALADIPPEPGSVSTTEIKGEAAATLAAFIGGDEVTFPPNVKSITFQKDKDGFDREFLAGRSAVKNDDKGLDVSIGCVSYYHMGYHDKCKLVRVNH